MQRLVPIQMRVHSVERGALRVMSCVPSRGEAEKTKMIYIAITFEVACKKVASRRKHTTDEKGKRKN